MPAGDPVGGAQTLILNGFAQSDIDMNFHRLLNWDNSNIPPPPAILPPTVVCPPRFWINGWNQSTMSWSIAQPGFNDLLRPTTTIDFGLQRITALANPIAQTDAVNLRTLANAIAQIPLTNPKAAVQAASTGFVDYPRIGGLHVIDGYQLQEGDRVLLKDQIDQFAYENTIWIAHAAVGAGSWTVAPDVDGVNPNNVCGASVIVLNGNTNQGSGWVNVNKPPIIVGHTPLQWVLYFPNQSGGGGGGNLVAGPGISISGNTISAVGTPNRISIGAGIDIDSGYIGQPSITTLGSVNIGTWQAGVIMPQFGGTGQSNQYEISIQGNIAIKPATGFTAPVPLDITLHGAIQMDIVASGSFYPIPPMAGHQGQLLSNDGVHLLWSGGVPPGIPSDNITGTTTNDDATPGNVGEFLRTVVPASSGQNFTTVATQRLFSIVLPPGDWDVRANLNFSGNVSGGGAVTSQADIGTGTTIAQSGYEGYGYILNSSAAAVRSWSIALPQRRVSLAAQTTYWVIAQCSLGTGTTYWGYIEARRMR